MCVPESWICKGYIACWEKETCAADIILAANCASNQFFCHSNETCISIDFVCDSIPDCAGLEDEANCEGEITSETRVLTNATTHLCNNI